MEDKEIFIAVKNNDVALVNKMINNNKSLLYERDYFGDLPIHEAAKTSLEMVKTLVNLGAKINQYGYDDQTPLFYAKNLEIAKYLVENGARIEAENYRCETPIFRHIYWNNNEIVEYLIEKGANCYKRSSTMPLIHYTINKINKDNDYLFDLICKNCDTTVISQSVSSLNYAVSKNNLKWIKKLVEMGNDIKYIVSSDSSTLLHYAARHTVSKEVFEYLIESGIDINAKTKYDKTALMEIARYGRYDFKEAKEIIELLLKNGAETELKDDTRHTAKEIARYSMNDAVYDALNVS